MGQKTIGDPLEAEKAFIYDHSWQGALDRQVASLKRARKKRVFRYSVLIGSLVGVLAGFLVAKFLGVL